MGGDVMSVGLVVLLVVGVILLFKVAGEVAAMKLSKITTNGKECYKNCDCDGNCGENCKCKDK